MLFLPVHIRTVLIRCRRISEFFCYIREIRASATLQVNAPYLTLHVLRCAEEAHFNCAQLCSRM